VRAHPLLLHLPSPVKLQCTLHAAEWALGRLTNPASSLVKICTLWLLTMCVCGGEVQGGTRTFKEDQAFFDVVGIETILTPPPPFR
jgi:hypothetical protein